MNRSQLGFGTHPGRWLAVLGLVLATLATREIGELASSRPLEPAQAAVSPCRSEPGRTGKTAFPPVVGRGRPVTITLRLGLRCPVAGLPLDAVLLMDRSSSMAGSSIADARRAALAFVDAVDLGRSRLALASFAQRATTDQELTRDVQRLGRAIRELEAQGDTNISSGLAEASRILARSGSPPGTVSAVILLTDGRDRYGAEFVRRQASVLKAAGIHIVTVGLGFDVDRALLEEIATTPDDAWFAPRSEDLIDIYLRLAGRMQALDARDLVLVDELPPDMRYLPGSARPAADEQPGRLEWRLPVVPAAGITLTYQVAPQTLGLRPTNRRAEARYLDSDGAEGRHVFPLPEVLVLASPPTATATPSATPTASSTATPTATPSATPTASASPSATASATAGPSPTPTGTPGPSPSPGPSPTRPPLLLPLLLARACHEAGQPLELVLVLDSSTTMEQPIGDGRRKLDLAIEAATRLAGLLQPPRERIGLVRFHHRAELLLPLGEDPSAVARALQGLGTESGSHIEAGLEAARLALSERRRPGSRAAVVLLTDGLLGGPTEAEVLAAAQRLKAAGVTVWVTGLVEPGSRIDLMRAIASGPGRYLDAGDGAGLVELYADIAGGLACP